MKFYKSYDDLEHLADDLSVIEAEGIRCDQLVVISPHEHVAQAHQLTDVEVVTPQKTGRQSAKEVLASYHLDEQVINLQAEVLNGGGLVVLINTTLN